MIDKENEIRNRKDPVSLLLEKVPEYRTHLDDQFLDLPYIVFGFFAQYLVKSVDAPDIIRRVFELLNELCDSGDPEMQNLVQVGIFETITGDRRWLTLAKSHLGSEGLRLFHDIESPQKRK